MPDSKSSHKKYTQLQLTKIFCLQAGIQHDSGTLLRLRTQWWYNPIDDHSLRLSITGLKLVKAELKLTSYEFDLPADLTNRHLLQLEHLFKGMYFLLKRKKIVVFDDDEALMLTLHGSNLAGYLDHLEIQGK